MNSRKLFAVAAAAAVLMLGATLSAEAANTANSTATMAPQLGSYSTGACGAYYGLNTMGGAGSVNGGTPGASVIEGDIGVTLGYGCPIGTTPGNFWFVEGNFDFANVNGATSGLSVSGPADFEQRFGFGGPISTMFGSFPGLTNGLAVPSLPALPSGVTAGPSYPFMFVSLHEQDIGAQVGVTANREWLVSPGFGIGLESRLSNGVVAEMAAQWVLQSSGLAVGPDKVTLGNAAEVSLTLKY